MSSGLRVAYAIDGIFIGGGHRHVLMLAEGLQARGGFPIVLVSGDGPFTDELKGAGLKSMILPMGKKLSIGKLLQWKRALQDLSIDVLHLHGGVAGFWGRLMLPSRRPFKTIWTVHGIHYPNHPNKLVGWVWRTIFRFLKNKADMTICVSRADFHIAIGDKIANESEARVISNGIELDTFKPQAEIRTLSGQGVPIRVGIVGRLTRVKGQRYALEALAMLKDKYQGLKFIFCGVGEDWEDLNQLVAKMGLAGRVIFAGFQKDIPAAYRQLDICLMPSLWEGQGLTLLESMAAGVPMIASGLDCVKEIVSHERECLLVPSKNPEALANSIQRLIEDEPLRRKLIANGLSTSSQFGINTMVDETINLYHRVIKNEATV